MFKLVMKSRAVPKVIQRALGSDGQGLLKVAATPIDQRFRTISQDIATASHSTKVNLGTKESPWDSILKREVFLFERYKHVKNTGITNMNMEPNGRYVDITWEDGHESRFHAIWLRHQCHCSSCRLPHTARISVDFEQLDVESVKILSALEDDGVLIFSWQDNETGDVTHEGMIPAAYLREHCYSERADQERRKQLAMTFSDDTTIPILDYNAMKADEKEVYKWMKILSEKGLCLVQNVPPVHNSVLEVGSIVGPIMQTWYGDSFDVQHHAHTDNPNFTSVRLFLHMDLIYYESPPGFQLLNCLQFDESTLGGESTFADIFKIATEFREEHPEDFDILCQVPIMFETIHYHRDPPVHLQTNRPIISLNRKGEIVSVSWHPMTFGALKCSNDLVEPFYRAYGKMFKAIQQCSDLYQWRLRPGDCITFNNRRILHARNSFQVQTGSRLLQGAYVEITAFQGKMQMLNHKYGDGSLAMRCGNFDYY